MVQAALPIVGGLLAGAGSAFANQGRRQFDRPAFPSVALAMASTQDKKQSKALAKAAREDRILYFLSQPEVIGLLVTIAGIYASQNIPFSKNPVANEGMQSISTMASVLIGLGYAGVGDLTTLLVAAIAGGVSLTDIVPDIDFPDFPDINMPDIDWLDWIKNINPLGGLLNLLS